MKKSKITLAKIVFASIMAAMFSDFQSIFAQEENNPITIYTYRRVEQGKMNEVLERETKYWKKVAQKDIDEGRLLFWAVLQKVGGVDLENSSNVLYINTLADIDNTDGMWDVSAVFPDVPMEDIEVMSMSTVTSTIFVQDRFWRQKEGVNPMEDFKYVQLVYHNANNPSGLIAAEEEVWAPFIKSAMDNGKVTQTAWGNAIILSPTGEDYNTLSFDLYPSLKEALSPTWAEDIEIPDMTKINEAEGNPRASVVYRFIDEVSAE